MLAVPVVPLVRSAMASAQQPLPGPECPRYFGESDDDWTSRCRAGQSGASCTMMFGDGTIEFRPRSMASIDGDRVQDLGASPCTLLRVGGGTRSSAGPATGSTAGAAAGTPARPGAVRSAATLVEKTDYRCPSDEQFYLHN